MNPLTFALRDSATLFKRDVRHSLRYLPMTLSGIMTPVIMLVLFVYFFGGALGSSLMGAEHGAYINFVAPGILIMTIASGCATTAINVVTDMSEGIIARFRTMPISRASVLTGQVLGSLLQTLISVGVVTLVALLLGFRPTTNPIAWLEAYGVIALFTFGVTWMGVLYGLIGKTPAGANSLVLTFLLLSFTSSAFVSTATMPSWLRWYADYQPFTPVIDTVRGLLMGTPITTTNVILAIAWSVGLALLGFILAQMVYNRSAA